VGGGGGSGGVGGGGGVWGGGWGGRERGKDAARRWGGGGGGVFSELGGAHKKTGGMFKKKGEWGGESPGEPTVGGLFQGERAIKRLKGGGKTKVRENPQGGRSKSLMRGKKGNLKLGK